MSNLENLGAVNSLDATGFKIKQVLGEHESAAAPAGAHALAAPAPAPAAAEPPLGPLAALIGNWAGNGFNTIFRPSQPSTGSDNVLELNVTTETLDFSTSLGSIPNRGEVQPDIFLNGVSYLQKVNDVTTPGSTTGIHFEPGIWLSVPATTNPAVNTPTLVRMASIPHGTTILAQGTSTSVAGPPVIPPLDITPFPIGNPANKIKFPSQTAATPSKFRIPGTLPVKGTTLTVADWQAMLNDPNSILRKIVAAQKITNTVAISVSTGSASPLVGSGVRDIAFLDGITAPNAQVELMTSTFFIETVSVTLDIPAGDPAKPKPVIVSPKVLVPGQPVPRFRVTPKTNKATTKQVQYKQVQYTQTVNLNFATLTWPHVSIATLVPADVIELALP
ncbi:MAG: heme-binding protein [Planctomycetaceae bacterium]